MRITQPARECFALLAAALNDAGQIGQPHQIGRHLDQPGRGDSRPDLGDGAGHRDEGGVGLAVKIQRDPSGPPQADQRVSAASPNRSACVSTPAPSSGTLNFKLNSNVVIIKSANYPQSACPYSYRPRA